MNQIKEGVIGGENQSQLVRRRKEKGNDGGDDRNIKIKGNKDLCYTRISAVKKKAWGVAERLRYSHMQNQLP